ncbi:MAG: hypothetical protein NC394_10210 [Bacteroides sp.]|nr:hypothetical protein [Bacteroides sp.]
MFVIYAVQGREDNVMRHLRENGYNAYVPKRRLKQRKNGIFYSVPQILFPSYVFIDAEKLSPEAYYKIKSTSGVGYFLNAELPMLSSEASYIKDLCQDEEIGISKGVLVNGKLKITEGFLKRYEDRIIRYDRRQHRATVELTLYGKPHRIVCGIDIEKKHEETALVDTLPALCRNADIKRADI